MGARAVPAGGFAGCSRAAWVSVPRHDDRGGRCFPGLGQAKAGNARWRFCQRMSFPENFAGSCARPRPRKPGLKLSLRDDDSLW